MTGNTTISIFSKRVGAPSYPNLIMYKNNIVKKDAIIIAMRIFSDSALSQSLHVLFTFCIKFN